MVRLMLIFLSAFWFLHPDSLPWVCEQLSALWMLKSPNPMSLHGVWHLASAPGLDRISEFYIVSTPHVWGSTSRM
ncbi:hypothetical protein CPB85DRAFT_1286059 [Mucidula mucida]|nr:hypothetical protein CPB85DRAFT_1286059 [Mucidula mucida]